MNLQPSFNLFPEVEPRPEGNDSPVFLRSASFEYPEYTRLDLRSGFVILIGDMGITLYETESDFNEGLDAIAVDPPENADDWPFDGWIPVRAWADQTGGMVMVDRVEFSNGWIASITPECVACHRTDDFEGLHLYLG